MSEGTLRQILLITDGHSNEGEDPVAVAALAHEQSIIVNVIGIVDENHLHEQGMQEIENISNAAMKRENQGVNAVQIKSEAIKIETEHSIPSKCSEQIAKCWVENSGVNEWT